MVLNGPVGDESTSPPFKYPYSVESQGPRLLARDLLRGDRAISLPSSTYPDTPQPTIHSLKNMMGFLWSL